MRTRQRDEVFAPNIPARSCPPSDWTRTEWSSDKTGYLDKSYHTGLPKSADPLPNFLVCTPVTFPLLSQSMLLMLKKCVILISGKMACDFCSSEISNNGRIVQCISVQWFHASERKNAKNVQNEVVGSVCGNWFEEMTEPRLLSVTLSTLAHICKSKHRSTDRKGTESNI